MILRETFECMAIIALYKMNFRYSEEETITLVDVFNTSKVNCEHFVRSYHRHILFADRETIYKNCNVQWSQSEWSAPDLSFKSFYVTFRVVSFLNFVYHLGSETNPFHTEVKVN